MRDRLHIRRHFSLPPRVRTRTARAGTLAGLALVAGAALVTPSCSPAGPSPKSLQIQEGPYTLAIVPDPLCTLAEIGSVRTQVLLTHEAGTWVARSAAPSDGTLDFKFHEVGNRLVAGVALSGTMTGVAYDSIQSAPPLSVLMSAGGGSGAASVSAQTTPSFPDFIAGRIEGELTIGNGEVSRTCRTGDFGLWLPVPCDTDPAAPCQ
jgi:hypothetical protein